MITREEYTRYIERAKRLYSASAYEKFLKEIENNDGLSTRQYLNIRYTANKHFWEVIPAEKTIFVEH